MLRFLMTLTSLALLISCRREIPHSFAGAWQALPAELQGEAQGMAAHWSVQGRGGAVSTANALATEAGVEVLRRGGNAIDAALAAQWALAVTEPQSSGLGGGGFMLYYEARTGKVYALDGREEAPSAIDPKVFLDASGKPLPFPARIAGGRAVGVPGTVALMQYAHERFGSKKLTFADTLARAIDLADGGIRVSARLHQAMRLNRERLMMQNGSSIPLLRSGQAYSVGEVLVQSELAGTLRRLAAKGAADFYRGEIASDILATLHANQEYRSPMSREDLALYRVCERSVVSLSLGNTTVFSLGAPASGAAVIQALKDAPTTRSDDAAVIYRSLGAQRIAFVEREKNLEDPDFAVAKKTGQLSDGAQNTTHLAIADAEGNVVSYTSSVETSLGSGIFVRGRGFVLNNQLSDFQAEQGRVNSVENGRRRRLTALNAEAREGQGGKRPRSSMSPLIIKLSDGRVVALGSPGGPTIVGTVALVAARVLAGDDLQEAILRPRALQMPNGKTLLELPLKRDPAFIAELKRRGFDADLRRQIISLGSVQAVAYDKNGIYTAANDLRREGLGLVVNPLVGTP